MLPNIYRIDFPDGQFYIGSTVNFSERRRTHLRHGRAGKAVNTALQAAFDAHPVCCIYQVASGFSRETLHILEQQIIAQERPTLNVNMRPQPLPKKYSGVSKTWGPHKCLRDAAGVLGKTYAAVKKLAARYSYDEYTSRPKPDKQPKFYGPPDPRNNTALIANNGWFRKSDIAAVPIKTAKKRREKGWSAWDALVTPKGEPNPQLGKRVSAAQVCRERGADPQFYYIRIRRGWTHDEALGITERPKKCTKNSSLQTEKHAPSTNGLHSLAYHQG